MPCLWQRVIYTKYIRGWPIAEWIRLNQYEQRAISNIWRAFLKVMPILKKWLAWRPGDGWSIRVGRDPILGLTDTYRLSEPLLAHLLNRRIYYLAQIAIDYVDDRSSGWADAQTLDLLGPLAIEWDAYIYKIRNSGLRLQHCKDSLY